MGFTEKSDFLLIFRGVHKKPIHKAVDTPMHLMSLYHTWQGKGKTYQISKKSFQIEKKWGKVLAILANLSFTIHIDTSK